MTDKNVLISPLNWGLGHATRIVPVIQALINYGYNPIIIGNGDSLKYLKLEFPNLIFEEISGLDIKYTTDKKRFNWFLIKQLPTVYFQLKSQRDEFNRCVEKFQPIGIISDNQPLLYSNKIKSVYITHQTNIMAGRLSNWITKIHQSYIKKYDCCWIPDFTGMYNLSGVLSHNSFINEKCIFINPLSRFVKQTNDNYRIDKLFIISGPEPSRTKFEEKIIKIARENGSLDKVVIVGGKIEKEQKKMTLIENVEYFNFLTKVELEQKINESKIIISRSGYSSIMDYAVMNKKVFLIPTPGQKEQEYLAKYLKNRQIAPSCKEIKFTWNKLEKVPFYSGFEGFQCKNNWEELFTIFQSK